MQRPGCGESAGGGGRRLLFVPVQLHYLATGTQTGGSHSLGLFISETLSFWGPKASASTSVRVRGEEETETQTGRRWRLRRRRGTEEKQQKRGHSLLQSEEHLAPKNNIKALAEHSQIWHTHLGELSKGTHVRQRSQLCTAVMQQYCF